MILIQRPGQDPIEIESLLVDFEGTLASDGRVPPKAKDKINLLSKRLRIFIFARGEREKVEETLKKVKGEIIHITEGEAVQRKTNLLREVGPIRSVAIGNGKDDMEMIEEAGFGICVVGKEGAFGETVKKADLVVLNILDALDFLLKPLRQKATLGK
jgi:soluble P-type ATPase